MSKYQAIARSNYFVVKDEREFREWAELAHLTVLESVIHPKPSDGVCRHGITPEPGGDGGWPARLYNEDLDEYEGLDILKELSAHLADGEVAILMEIGNEELLYLTGSAQAVNAKGETVNLNLQSIYHLGRALCTITKAEY